MKKKAIVFCLLGAMASSVCTVSAAQGTQEIPATFRGIKVIVDGKELAMSAEPFIYNGTTYLPIRAVGEAVGKEVLWDKDTNTISLYNDPPVIDAGTEPVGNLEFTLSVTPSGKKERAEILRINETRTNSGPSAYSLYYYGLSDVSITLDGQTLPLAQALEEGKITEDDILHKGYQDEQDGRAKGMHYRDGGSAAYVYGDYAILKYNTLDGKQDFYIGIPEMEINALDEQFDYVHFRSIKDVIGLYADYAAATDNQQERKEIYDEGIALLSAVAMRDHTSDAALKDAVRQLAEACGIE